MHLVEPQDPLSGAASFHLSTTIRNTTTWSLCPQSRRYSLRANLQMASCIRHCRFVSGVAALHVAEEHVILGGANGEVQPCASRTRVQEGLHLEPLAVLLVCLVLHQSQPPHPWPACMCACVYLYPTNREVLVPLPTTRRPAADGHDFSLTVWLA